MSLQYDSFRINSSSEIPASLVPESSNHLIANVSKENAYVTATNSQTAGPNSFLLFSIPNRGFLEPNSLSLGFTVAIQSQVAGDTVGFCYPDRTANALIQRITMMPPTGHNKLSS